MEAKDGTSGRGLGTAALIAASTILGAGSAVRAQGGMEFLKQQVTAEYHAEGADRADIDRDGDMDLVSGPYWFEGPELLVRHAYQAVTVYNARTDYTKTFFTWAQDFDGDQWPDILSTGVPGSPGYWFRNPGPGAAGNSAWTRREAIPVLGNESPGLHDLDGDGKPELVFNTNDGYAGWARSVPGSPDLPWLFHRITPKGAWERFTHGLGVGDVNGDGRADLLENSGWWEQPADLAGDPVWVKHAFQFGARGGAQMFAHDFDGDGDRDIVAALDAHGWGLAWFEQVPKDGAISFVKHALMGDRTEEARYGIAFSQPHALALADLDGDGLLDLVTGKRKWAHGPDGDVEPNAAFILAVFRARRTGGTATFTPVILDTASGVGTQLEVKDISGDGLPDILVGNKNGIFVFRKQGGVSIRSPRIGPNTLSAPSPRLRNIDALGVEYPLVRGGWGSLTWGRRLFHYDNSDDNRGAKAGASGGEKGVGD